MMRPRDFVLALAFCAVAMTARAGEVDLQWGVKIPLRDGVRLNATVYRPRDQAAPSPCVFTLTPYIAQSYHDRGMYFAAHGVPFLTVDVRGRGNSEGEFHPLIQEAKDGYDVVEWLARQPYCNGKVSMWGGSYAGYDQWVTAKERPPHLATIVPVASPYATIDFPSTNLVFAPYGLQWLTFTSGHASQENIFGDSAFWTKAFDRWFRSGAPLTQLDVMTGVPSKTFHEWLSHPEEGPYWAAYNPTSADYAALTIPILTITGVYDGDQAGALKHYKEYMRVADDAGRARHFLIIGPWDHAGTRTPRDEVGGVKFGPASLLDIPQLHLDWYRWTMSGGEKPAFLKKPVAYYVTGADVWRYADSLAAITGEAKPYYLASTGDAAADVLASGRLEDDPARAGGGSDHYVYDPRDVSIAALETGPPDGGELTSQKMVYGRRGRDLIYHTAPFAADTEVSGFFKFSAWLSIDQPDTDFAVEVDEIREDGTSVRLTSDVKRARYRQGLDHAALVKGPEPLLYDFDSFTFTSRKIAKGSRLRLVFGPSQGINVEKNYNAGGVVAEESVKDARPVTVKLLHEKGRASVLYVPIAAHSG
jgi:putative CocE/NonD family hydrolase